jgi:hypothetical protein
MKTRKIDWEEVARAMRRSKTASPEKPGDYELCLLAFEADPKHYKEVHTKMVEQVTEEVRNGLPVRER